MPEALPATSSPSSPLRASALPAATPRVPDYELLRIIGRGSYGDVWLARGITGLYRAVKLVWRDRFADPQPYEREFHGLREFAAISIAESRQLALLHVGRNDAAGFFYYVMELADDLDTGREIDPDRYVPHTLSAAQQRHGRRPARDVVTLAVELARALAGLHARGLVHRDVKPSNVIFVGGAPKLADIGLVTAATAAHTFVGTEGFVPPEGPGTPAADVFSLGKLLYETATGLDRHDYPRLPADLGALPDRKELLELNEILIRACDPAAAQRYPDAAALLDDLLLLQAGRSMRRLRATERSLTRAVRIGAALALIAAIAAGGAFVERRRAEDENSLRRRAEAERDDLARKSLYSAGLARAQRALELGDLGRARQHLQELVPAAHQPDLRGFEWHALWHEAQGDPAIVLREDGPAAERVRFSPDGKLIAVHTADKRVTLWDAATKQVLRHIEGIHRFAGFSSDAQWLVGTDASFGPRRWRIVDGVADQPAPGGVNRPLGPIAGDRLLLFNDAPADSRAVHTLRVWDFNRRSDATRIPIPAFAEGVQWDFFRSALSDDGSTCALVLLSGRGHESRHQLLVIDISTGRRLHSETLPHRPVALAFSHNRNLAVVLGDNNSVQLLDVTKDEWRWRRSIGFTQSNTLAFSADDARLAVAGRDHVVRILDSTTGEQLTELRGHHGVIDDLAWTPAGSAVVSVTNTGGIRLWPDVDRRRDTAEGFWSPVNIGSAFLAVSPDGTRIAVPHDGQNVDVLAAATLSRVARLGGPLSPLAFSSESSSLLTLTARGMIQRWRLDDVSAGPVEVFQFFNSQVPVHSATVSSDHRWAAAASPSGRLQFADLSSPRLIAEHGAHPTSVWAMAMNAKRELLVTAGRGAVKLWDLPTGALRAEWPSTRDCCAIAFSHDSRWLVLGYTNGDVEIHSGPALEVSRVLRAGSARVQTVAFSPDGTRLVCGGPRGMVQVFATDDWRELLTFSLRPSARNVGESNVVHVVFSNNESTLAALLADGRVRAWRK